MPEFILDHGSSDASARFNDLDAFTQGFITAAFWLIDEDLGDVSLADLNPEALTAMCEECADFQEIAANDLQAAYENEDIDYYYAPESAGVDFWLTRNGHGAGFWDRGFGDLRTDTIGGRLSRDAESFGECDLYRGDDGLLYLA